MVSFFLIRIPAGKKTANRVRRLTDRNFCPFMSMQNIDTLLRDCVMIRGGPNLFAAADVFHNSIMPPKDLRSFINQTLRQFYEKAVNL
jgi:hypothetical protein